MSKFNDTTTRPNKESPVVTETTPSGRTHEGGVGYKRDLQSELFITAVSNMVGEDTFYEDARSKDNRFARLVQEVALMDVEWLTKFVHWLRHDANMRSASVVTAAEGARARTKTGIPGGTRQLVNASMRRADEPGEFLAYWTSTYGRNLPQPVKRGVADAVIRLYSEYSLLKYDTSSHGWRFADVIELVHPKPRRVITANNRTIADIAQERGVPLDNIESELRKVADSIRETLPDDAHKNLSTAEFVRRPLPSLSPGWRSRTVARVLDMQQQELIAMLTAQSDPAPAWQGDLFQYAIDRRHNRENEPSAELRMVRASQAMRDSVNAGETQHLLDSDRLKDAGMTWEDVLSLAGSKLDKRELWEAVIPSMGYMALLRNLRNFDEAMVSEHVAQSVAAKLADPDEVARSRQLPMRFLSAYRAAPSLRWAYPLEQALYHCLKNIPALGGRTLVLIDTSSSMNESFSKDGTLMRWDAAVLFGVALAQRCTTADVVSFSSTRRYYGDPIGAKTKAFPLQAGESLLRSLERWKSGGWFLGGGTDTALALQKEYAGHDRVIIVTDEQANANTRGVSESIPANVPMYTWNLAGYEYGHAPSGGHNRHTFGGLTDAAFRMVSLLESGRDAKWPF